MKRILVLNGYACKSWIWDEINSNIKGQYKLDIVEWPNGKVSTFHDFDSYVRWITSEVLNTYDKYDIIMGHSMGGLIALYLAKKFPEKIKDIILVESFVTPPNKFFQNLIHDEVSQDTINRVDKMLTKEKKFYSKELPNQFRELDLTEILRTLPCNIHAIYGDRGVHDTVGVTSELKWNEYIKEKVKVCSIHNSCHFPMLENPMEFNEKLSTILKLK